MKSIKTFNTLAAAFALSLAVSHSALADTASGDLDIQAGLGEAMQLTCNTPLSFGVTRVGSNHDGEQALTIAPDGTTSFDTGADGLTADERAEAGVCTLTGSQNDGVEPDVTFSADVDLDGDADVLGLTEAGSLDNITISSFTSEQTSITDGESTITIGGEMEIPSDINGNMFGGYSGTVTVTADEEL